MAETGATSALLRGSSSSQLSAALALLLPPPAAAAAAPAADEREEGGSADEAPAADERGAAVADGTEGAVGAPVPSAKEVAWLALKVLARRTGLLMFFALAAYVTYPLLLWALMAFDSFAAFKRWDVWLFSYLCAVLPISSTLAGVFSVAGHPPWRALLYVTAVYAVFFIDGGLVPG